MTAFVNCDKHGMPVFHERGQPCPRCPAEPGSAPEHHILAPPADPMEAMMRRDGYHPVDRPEHYNAGNIECLDAMVAAFGQEAVENYAIVNCFKYLYRHRRKHGEQDLQKALFYLRFATGDDPRKDR